MNNFRGDLIFWLKNKHYHTSYMLRMMQYILANVNSEQTSSYRVSKHILVYERVQTATACVQTTCAPMSNIKQAAFATQHQRPEKFGLNCTIALIIITLVGRPSFPPVWLRAGLEVFADSSTDHFRPYPTVSDQFRQKYFWPVPSSEVFFKIK